MLRMRNLLTILFLAFPLSARAQVNSNNGYGGMTGNELLPMCQTAINQVDGKVDSKTVSIPMLMDVSRCLAYIQGFIDGFHIRDTVEENMPPTLCFPPEGATGEQMVRVVTKWLENHPARLHEPAWRLIFLAFQEAFLCPPLKLPQTHKP
jgi:hypothetical protein